MAKAKSKSKLDIKQFLLAKGEYVAMGVAGLFLGILMLWGITKWSSAKDPTDTVKSLNDGAQRVTAGISSPNQLTEDQQAVAKVPDWVVVPYVFRAVPVSAFPITGPQFDPVAKPDTKRENPNVLPIAAYQVDITHGAMKGFDITKGPGGEDLIAVISDKRIDTQDKDKMDKMMTALRGKMNGRPEPKRPNVPMGGQPPGSLGPMGGGQPPSPGGGQPPIPGGPRGGGSMGGYNPYGDTGGFDTGGQRVEKAIEYIATSKLVEAMTKGKAPAMTVVPLRMVTIHAEVPLKRQLEEIRRALRLPNTMEAEKWGPYYDGYNVRRKISRIMPGGKLEVLQDWKDYDFEERYQTLINKRKIADSFDEGYLGYFVRYEMALALPLPQLVTEVGKYPEIKLKNILETIEKLKNAAKPPLESSKLRDRVLGGTSKGDLYRPLAAQDTGGSFAFGSDAAGGKGFDEGLTPMPPRSGPGTGGPKPGSPIDPNNRNNPNLNNPVEIEHLLLRFIDVDVEPGLTYEYQIQLRMRNPNYKRANEVSKPSDAEKEFLDSPWVQLSDLITVPTETFLFASDWGSYYKKVKEDYEKEKDLQARLQVKDHQAVVEMCTWLEQVRTSDGGKREPIGAWVVANFGVGRGEYIGRKQYVKLPLWSSENKAYVLREIPDKVIQPKSGGLKEPPQPRGWLMDFTSNRSILVDFEGGKVRTKAGGKDVTEEVGTEMLVLRGDGKLVVKKSAIDDLDKDRKSLVSDWEKWIKEVAARKVTTSDDTGGFSPRGPGGMDR